MKLFRGRRATEPDEPDEPEDSAADSQQAEDVADTEDTEDTEDTVRLEAESPTDGPDAEPLEAPAADPEPAALTTTDAPSPVDDERTVRLTRRRFARRQWTRRWLAWRRVVMATLLVLVLVGSVWLVFFSSVLAVSGVQVVGTRVLSAAVVRQAAAVPTGTPLATADLGSVTARVERLPAVQRVDVSRSWPDKVRIAVTERRAVAVVEPTQPGGTLRGVDVHGRVFRTFATRPAHLPVIRTAGHTGSEALAEAAAVAGSLPPKLAAKVAYVRVRTVDTITLLLHNGHAVRWGSADESHVKARVLAVLLGQHAAYYDVSVPGQPVIRK